MQSASLYIRWRGIKNNIRSSGFRIQFIFRSKFGWDRRMEQTSLKTITRCVLLTGRALRMHNGPCLCTQTFSSFPMPLVFTLRKTCCTHLRNSRHYSHNDYSVFVFRYISVCSVMIFILPGLVIFYCYYHVFCKLREAAKGSRRLHRNKSSRSSYQRVTRSVQRVVLFHLLCWLVRQFLKLDRSPNT